MDKNFATRMDGSIEGDSMEENKVLEKVQNQVAMSGTASVEGESATREIESKLVELGYRVTRDVCPVLLRKRLLVTKE